MQGAIAVATDIIMGTVNCFVYLIYYAVWMVVSLLQWATSLRSKGYDHKCRIMRIIWRRKFIVMWEATPMDFLSIHDGFVHPGYILKQTVSLYCVTREEAIFVETPQDINIYSSDVNPFQFIAQFRHATKLIRMPILYFNILADSLGKPMVPVVFMASTGRCGSTILAQMLENIPGTQVHAEPDCLTNLSLDRTLPNSEKERLLVSSIKILCKPMNEISRICIKTRSFASIHMLKIAKLFPEIKIIYVYRCSKATVSSFLGLMISENVLRLSLSCINSDWFSKMLPWFRRKLHYIEIRVMDTNPPLVRCEDMNAVELFTYKWACCMALVQDLKNQGGDVLPVLYEDVLRDEREECKKVFNYLQIDHQHLGAAVAAFEKDSQRNSPLRRKNIQNFERRRINSEDRLRADTILSKFALPGLGQEYRL